MATTGTPAAAGGDAAPLAGLPPFELVNLLTSAFHPLHHVGPNQQQQQQYQHPSSSSLSSVVSPSRGGSSTAAAASSVSPPSGGVASHGGSGRNSPAASATNIQRIGSPGQQQGSVGDRLSQLIHPTKATTPGSASKNLPTAGASAGLGQAAQIVPPTASTSSAPPSAPVIRSADAGTETIYVAGNEGSIAVWRLDSSHVSSTSKDKGKQRALNLDHDEEERGRVSSEDTSGTTSDRIIESAEEAAYLLDQFNVVPSRRPIEKMAVLTTVGKAVVLSEGVLTVHSLPSFTPLPAFQPIRGVSTFAVDLISQSTSHSSSSSSGSAIIPMCIVKRKSIQLYRISQFAIEHLQDLPIKTTGILAVLNRNGFLCLADSINYSLIDLNQAMLYPLLPISQDPPEESAHHSDQADTSVDASTIQGQAAPVAKPKLHQKPLILAVDNNEFLVASHTGNSTLGIFIKENGDPTRGTLEWASNPKSMVMDYPYIISLLQNNNIEIHNLHTQELVQSIDLTHPPILLEPSATDSTRGEDAGPNRPSPHPVTSPSGPVNHFQPRLLASCTAGFPARRSSTNRNVAQSRGSLSPLAVPKVGSANSLIKVRLKLLPPKGLLDNDEVGLDTLSSAVPVKAVEAPSTPKRLQPSSAPKATSALTATRPSDSPRQFARFRATSTSAIVTVSASTLVLGKDSVLAICPLTLVAQADKLFEKGLPEQALLLLDAIGTLNTSEKVQEATYIRQKAAWSYLFETRFKEAGPLFTQGKTDPRLLISLFRDIKGRMWEDILARSQKSSEVAAFIGLTGFLGDDGHLKPLDIADIIRNYAPHLSPVSPTATDLHEKLIKAAKEMLMDFLKRWRTQRRNGADLKELGLVGEGEVLRDLDKLVDTALAKLYLELPSKHLDPLVKMLEQEAHDCEVDEIADLLEQNGLHWFLSQLYLLRGRTAETLKIWTELVDKKRADLRFSDGLKKIFNLLENSTDIDLVTDYGLWLVRHDSGLGIKLLTKPAAGVRLDVERCMQALRDIDEDVSDQFLENTVFTRKNVEPKYHDDLIDRYLTRLEAALRNEGLKERLVDLRQQYTEEADTTQESIIGHALNHSTSPPSEVTILRGKLVILLHASLLYDIDKVRRRLDGMDEFFFEKAIVHAKLGLHSDVLTVLASTLNDFVSAEAYCAYAGTGDILAPKNVREIFEKLGGLEIPALLRRDGRRKQQHLPPNTKSNNTAAIVPVAEREAKRKELLNLLIKISLEQSAKATASTRAQERAAHIIETQAIRISAKEILPSIPNEWELSLMESFVIRSMRRSLHERYETKLMKALLQERTMDLSLRYYELTESLGGTLAEEEDGAGSDDAGGEEWNEKHDGPGNDDRIVFLEKAHTQMDSDEKAIDLL